jgi:uncharacterized protein (DUF2147 family)
MMTRATKVLPWPRSHAAGALRYALVDLVLGVTANSAAAQMSVATSPPASAAPPPQAGLVGVWFDHSGRGAIEIMPCGSRFCGYVYWVKELLNRQGKPVMDRLNPDPKRRNKPMCGAQILSNLAEQPGAKPAHIWGGGSIYNPEEGEVYDAELTLTSPDQLSVRGYAGIKMFGETFIWKRAPVDLARCGPARS